MIDLKLVFFSKVSFNIKQTQYEMRFVVFLHYEIREGYGPAEKNAN